MNDINLIINMDKHRNFVINLEANFQGVLCSPNSLNEVKNKIIKDIEDRFYHEVDLLVIKGLENVTIDDIENYFVYHWNGINVYKIAGKLKILDNEDKIIDLRDLALRWYLMDEADKVHIWDLAYNNHSKEDFYALMECYGGSYE